MEVAPPVKSVQIVDPNPAPPAQPPVQYSTVSFSYMMPTFIPIQTNQNPIPILMSNLNLLNSSDIHFFTMEPLPDSELQAKMAAGANIGFKIISQQEMNFKKMVGFLEENKQLKVQTERLKDTLVNLHKEYKRFLEDPTVMKYVSRANPAISRLKRSSRRTKDFASSKKRTES